MELEVASKTGRHSTLPAQATVDMSTNPDSVPLLLVSDSLFMRRGLREVLSGCRGFLVHECGGAEEALALIKDLSPRGVIIDTDLRHPSGTELTARIRRHWPGVFVITMASHADDEELYAAIRAGSAVHLLKSVAADQLVAAVWQAHRGEYPINETVSENPRIARRILDQFQNFALSAGQGWGELIVPLNPRETEILQLVAHGNANKRIALLLGIKEQSVKNYISGILRKLAANDRAHAVFIAIKRGWLKTD